ncbi:MAG TPA: HAD-IC family P-type ATPase, partial [Phenylobacterium sp.]|nr:HAD-IC family P-type ATPase [Phenylobacterium sp.]
MDLEADRGEGVGRQIAPQATSPQEDARGWHALSGEAVLARLDTRLEGLEDTEVTARLAQFGPNTLPQAPRVHPVLRFLSHFNSALIYFLLASVVAAFLLGHVVDACVILAVVLVNAVIGFVQEGRAEQALGAIQKLISPSASVIRGGLRTSTPAERLVPGDLVLIEAGDRTPADLRLLRAHALTIDESLLTGESVTSEKRDAPVADAAPLGDRSDMAFSGTLVVAGQGMGVVVETGSRTQIGRVSKLVADVEPMSTPLLRQMNAFARQFTIFVAIGAALLFAVAVFVRGVDWADALIAVVALSVGVIPEGLPAVITITLAIGVQRMSRRNAAIRKLAAVETLGATSVICTDKTGTLTRNEMTVRHISLETHQLDVSGAGQSPVGTLSAPEGDDEAAIAAAQPILACGALCGDAVLREGPSGWKAEGDPMEGALAAVAMKAGLDPQHIRAAWPRVDQIPFDATYRYMATLHRGPAGECVAYVKGAPEAVLAMGGADQAEWLGRCAARAEFGERLLGFGMKRFAPGQPGISANDLTEGVQFLGVMGFIDPPREESVAAVAECRSAGIQIKMITGDHQATALAIARQVRLADNPKATTGAEVDRCSDEELVAVVRDVSVFARTSPESKLRIVRALQSGGAVVAMTGDGVNDAPPLKQASVGIAMGLKGTEAAKEAAEIVLLDDNFASIVAAIHEGRTVYDNIRKVIAWTLPTNGGESLGVIAAILLGFALPMTATQILWINLMLAGSLGLALAFEPSEPGVMSRT